METNNMQKYTHTHQHKKWLKHVRRTTHDRISCQTVLYTAVETCWTRVR